MSAVDQISELSKRQPVNVFYPRKTVRCIGSPSFRNQHARDVATLLDVGEDVVSWSCQPQPIIVGSKMLLLDFVVTYSGASSFVVAAQKPLVPDPALTSEAGKLGCTLSVVAPSDLPGVRLQNARDLMSNASFGVSLDERMRLLCFLDDCGSASLLECMSALRSSAPMAVVSSLFLQRFIDLDIDTALLAPDTIVRRRSE